MRAGDWAEVNALLDESSTGWGLGEYRAMTQAASQVTDWQGALRLLERMEADGKPADAAAYGHAVAACAKADQPTEGRSLLDKLQKAGVMAEARGYNQVMSSFARQRRWSEALGLLREMCAAGVTPTVISYNAALSACSKAGRWNEAIELLGEMEAGRSKGGGSVPAPDVISYSTVISACQKASTGTMGASASAALDTALELLERMRCSSKVPVPTDSAIVPDEGTAEVPKTAPVANVFTYTSAITALADAGRWEEALKTYASIPDDVEKNDAIVNAAVCAASVGGDWAGCLGRRRQSFCSPMAFPSPPRSPRASAPASGRGCSRSSPACARRAALSIALCGMRPCPQRRAHPMQARRRASTSRSHSSAK